MGQVEPDDLGLRPSPQGEEGPPSLEYIQAKDLFPPKELVKEEENLQVRKSWGPEVGRAPCRVQKTPSLSSPYLQISLRGSGMGALASCSWVSGGRGVCLLLSLGPQGRRELSCMAVAWCCYHGEDSCPALAWLFQRGSYESRVGEGSEWGLIPGLKSRCSWQVPFTVLQGEGVEFLGRAADALIAISNYRLHIKFKDSVINVSSSLVLPHPSHNRCEIQGGTASVLHLIASPKNWGSLLFLTVSQRKVCLSISVTLPPPLTSLSPSFCCWPF